MLSEMLAGAVSPCKVSLHFQAAGAQIAIKVTDLSSPELTDLQG